MIVELGHYTLVLALALAMVQSVVPVFGAKIGHLGLMRMANQTSIMMAVLISFSFGALTWAYVNSDFSVTNVWQNSHSLQPMLYKYSSVWGNHEGSLLLWVLILSLFASMVSIFGKNLPPELKANVLGVQAWILVAFLSFVLITSNPFERLDNPPLEGKDLNPILQDVGLAIHPPMLYIGYVGLSITFAFAMAALISGRLDAAWARWVRPWTLIAWIFLTAGIAMGSYWAYYELGWGGWWFWDPVENASFMPWLAATALLHSALVMEKREALKIWTVLLAIVAFSMSLLGTFLVRSGVLTSVHAFATDPERGVFILTILVLFIGGSLTLFVLRAGILKSGGLFAPISREGALVFNNLFLTSALATVLVGTLYPLMLEAVNGAKISVGPPFFNLTFGPLMMPLLLAVPFGPLLSWKRGDLLAALSHLYWAFGAALLAIILVIAFSSDAPILAALVIGLAFWLMIGAFAEISLRTDVRKNGLAKAFDRARGLPGSTWGTAFAHFGLGVTLLGIVSVSIFETEVIKAMKVGESATISGHQLTLKGINPRKASNYNEDIINFEVLSPKGEKFIMRPAKRIYTTRRMPTTESAINTSGFSQLYVSLGEVSENNLITVRMWWKPQVTLIWLGSLFMMFGGLLSLADRRLRVGAPKRAVKQAKVETDVQVPANG
ncbi:MAG: heme lyase CcmF/NrfE family subunit [Hyphomicrobiales bacterium]|nr:heme lyase CcmF/NrfE family subunit [Hyphomicrobiales bacterium]